MSDLIEALQIFLGYGNPEYPTNCGHDMLSIHIDGLEYESMKPKDRKRLEALGFIFGDPYKTGECYWYSFRFGSC